MYRENPMKRLHGLFEQLGIHLSVSQFRDVVALVLDEVEQGLVDLNMSTEVVELMSESLDAYVATKKKGMNYE